MRTNRISLIMFVYFSWMTWMAISSGFAMGNIQESKQDGSDDIGNMIKAAELGITGAQINLGIIYGEGKGSIRKDYVKAYMWLELASNSISRNESTNPSMIANYRNQIAKEMTSDQIEEAHQLAREWMLNHDQKHVVSDGPPRPTPPIVLSQPLPPYTDEARRARVEGMVAIQCIVRKEGTVDSFKIIKGLGYGLDESAINTIATKWRFKPAILNGVAVDMQANIVVSFKIPK
jgi:TonB family protein